jgi:hypothetical protein
VFWVRASGEMVMVEQSSWQRRSFHNTNQADFEATAHIHKIMDIVSMILGIAGGLALGVVAIAYITGFR